MQLKCHIDPKCKFMVWYAFEKDGENLKAIKYFRSINLNHEISCHKVKGCY